MTWRQYNVHYIPHLQPTTAYMSRFVLCQIWSCQILWNCCTSYSGFKIQKNVSPQLLVKCRQVSVRYTLYMLPNTGYSIRFVLRELWSLSSPMQLQYGIFMLQCLIECISATIGEMSTIWRALCSTYAAKYWVQHPVCAAWTLVAVKFSVLAVLQIVS